VSVRDVSGISNCRATSNFTLKHRTEEIHEKKICFCFRGQVATGSSKKERVLRQYRWRHMFGNTHFSCEVI